MAVEGSWVRSGPRGTRKKVAFATRTRATRTSQRTAGAAAFEGKLGTCLKNMAGGRCYQWRDKAGTLAAQATATGSPEATEATSIPGLSRRRATEPSAWPHP